jgi:hypothetical protein
MWFASVALLLRMTWMDFVGGERYSAVRNETS